MSYAPDWTQQDAAGHVLAGDWVCAADVNELCDAVNRRLKAMFDAGSRWPMNVCATGGQFVAGEAIQAIRDGILALIPYGSRFVHDAGWDQLSMWAQWLYPVAGADENKVIVRDGKPPGDGEVGFFAMLNGGTAWTGGVAGASPAAAHVNEPRDAAAMLCRGRYTFRVGDGGAAKASKELPGGLWYPPAVARDGDDEMHSWFGGRQWLWPSDGAGGFLGPRGQDAAVRSATMRLQPQGADAKVKLYHCKRNVNAANFSWTQYDATAALSWAAPGGGGAADAELLAGLELSDGTWRQLDLTSLVGQMFAGQAEPTFMLAPDEDTGWPEEPTHIAVELTIDFEWSGG